MQKQSQLSVQNVRAAVHMSLTKSFKNLLKKLQKKVTPSLLDDEAFRQTTYSKRMKCLKTFCSEAKLFLWKFVWYMPALLFQFCIFENSNCQ
jgi:hypothetical protein